MKIPNVTERLQRDSVGKTRASNLVYTTWAVFGGFILHFLFCNYLEILMNPRLEKPVETAADIIKRDITPFVRPYGYENLRENFAASNDSNYQEISRRLLIPTNYNEFFYYVYLVTHNGSFSQIGTIPGVYEDELNYWYRSSETIGGFNPYRVHLTNKKWPLKKVLLR